VAAHMSHGGRTFSTGSCYKPVLKGDHVACPERGSGLCHGSRLPQNVAAAEPVVTPRDRHLKYIDAHIHQTIILHNIVMNIEIEASVIFHCAW
jgi:hypothetical protein